MARITGTPQAEPSVSAMAPARTAVQGMTMASASGRQASSTSGAKSSVVSRPISSSVMRPAWTVGEDLEAVRLQGIR